jgi:hypothetical protein
MNTKYKIKKITVQTTALRKAGVSPSMCIKAQTIKYALKTVRIMNIQFNKFIPTKFVMCKGSGLIIPRITSNIVTTESIMKTFQILFVLETCSCDIIYIDF